jgi:outer membrane protein
VSALLRVRAVILGAFLLAAKGVSAQSPSPLTLIQAMQLAARQSAGPMVARLEAQQARERVRTQRARLLPSLSVDAAQTGRTINTATFGISFPSEPGQPPLFDPNGEVIGPVRLLDLRAHGTMVLFDWSAVLGVRSAASAAEGSDAEAEFAAETAALSAANIYLQVQRNEAVVAARLADSTLADSLLGIARAQFEAGSAVRLDVTRAASQAAAVRADLIAARSARDRSHLQLRHAIGVPADTTLELSDSLPITPEDTTRSERDIVRQALLRRADIRAASAALGAAQQSLSAEKAARLPTLEAFGTYGTIGTGTDHLLGTYDWGIQMTLPIFTGFERESRIAEMRARSHELAVQRQDLLDRVALDVRSARLDLTAAEEQVEAARNRRRLAEQEVVEARERFQNGLAGNADVVSALLSLDEARTSEIDAVTADRTAAISLAYAMGTLLEPR